jgi:chorismate mutase
MTKKALHDTAQKFEESDRTIERYLEEARSLCEAVARAKANVAKK